MNKDTSNKNLVSKPEFQFRVLDGKEASIVSAGQVDKRLDSDSTQSQASFCHIDGVNDDD